MKYTLFVTSLPMKPCNHDYQLETVGGVYLTGAYVCRLCSYRIGMSHEQFHEQAAYPGHYQANVSVGETVEERAHQTRERYRQRLKEQVAELLSENLPPMVSEDERNEILTEVIGDALLQIAKDCQKIANDAGHSEGKAVAEVSETKIADRWKDPASAPPATPLSGSRRGS